MAKGDWLTFTVLGDVPCIKNGLLRSRNGRMFYKPEIPAYFESFKIQASKVLKGIKSPLSNDIFCHLTIVRKDKRKDPLNICDTIHDALQKSGVIDNDRNIVVFSYNAQAVDKNEPYVRISIREQVK